MNRDRRRKSGCTRMLMLLVLCLIPAYLATHLTFLPSLIHMASSNESLTIVWSTPTGATQSTSAHVGTTPPPTPTRKVPTATPMPLHATATARPVKRTETPVTLPDAVSGENVALLISGMLLFLAIFAGVYVRVIVVPLRRARRKSDMVYHRSSKRRAT